MRSRPAALAVILLLIVIAIAIGALYIGVADTTTSIIWNIRGPRVVMAILIGSGLALAGVLMQGSLSNPLADPALVGVSAGAALGGVAAVSLGASFNTAFSALGACAGGAIALAVVTSISIRNRVPEVVTLLLAGVAVTAFAGALLTVLVSVSDSTATRSVTFWSTGSLSLTTWAAVLTVAPFVIVGAGISATMASSLDVLSLGDRAANALGVNVSAVRYRALIAVVLLVSVGVSSVGVIAFVGLLVPHAVRMIIGPRHGPLLLISALAGTLLILVTDTASRVVANPIEVPIGAITAVVGAPIFFILIRRTRASQGGWA